MSVRRYSRDPRARRWEEQFDELQRRCWVDYYSPTIGELLEHGIQRGRWECRSQGACLHQSEPFGLARFKPAAKVSRLRRQFVCSCCGRGRPDLRLLAES